MNKYFIVMTVILLSGCSILPSDKPRDLATYDLGIFLPSASQTALASHILVPDVEAPQWLEGPGIYYRLAYQNSARLQPYANSRWVASPASLITLRLHQRFAHASSKGATTPDDMSRADYVLRVQVEEFSQVFDTPTTSTAIVRMTANLIGTKDRLLVAQKSFSVNRPATTPDAAGGVRALSEAIDETINQILEWSSNTAK